MKPVVMLPWWAVVLNMFMRFLIVCVFVAYLIVCFIVFLLMSTWEVFTGRGRMKYNGTR